MAEFNLCGPPFARSRRCFNYGEKRRGDKRREDGEKRWNDKDRKGTVLLPWISGVYLYRRLATTGAVKWSTLRGQQGKSSGRTRPLKPRTMAGINIATVPPEIPWAKWMKAWLAHGRRQRGSAAYKRRRNTVATDREHAYISNKVKQL